ncbi:uncharacterized protein LOC126659658 [Mercurialis annua]|uniref:uncharacterized protein LOC126659658 n=1 Tax=Mercurialis annua TaxID=3986 RepID=UPI00215E0337|nr:uncharacterized protein LOC126659658 [Mercurialis annua]
MDTIATFIQYNGYWNDKLQYTNFSVKGLLIPKDSSMNNLEQLLANQLQVNLEEENLKIKYQVKPDYPPLIIQDNDALVFYFQMKSKQSDPTQFPLCIEIEKKNERYIIIRFIIEINTTKHQQKCRSLSTARQLNKY